MLQSDWLNITILAWETKCVIEIDGGKHRNFYLYADPEEKNVLWFGCDNSFNSRKFEVTRLPAIIDQGIEFMVDRKQLFDISVHGPDANEFQSMRAHVERAKSIETSTPRIERVVRDEKVRVAFERLIEGFRKMKAEEEGIPYRDKPEGYVVYQLTLVDLIRQLETLLGKEENNPNSKEEKEAL